MNPNLSNTAFQDTGIPSANAPHARVLPIAKGQGGGMRTTQEASVASMWMNPVDSPRPGGLYMGSVAQ
jgi:hypothetical protein